MKENPFITVIVTESNSVEPYGRGLFWAFVAGNPDLRASGDTEEEALDRLRRRVITGCLFGNEKRVKAVEMRFDDLLVEDVMNR